MAETQTNARPFAPEVARVSILGATGSVGVNTLNVIEQHGAKFAVSALTANNNIDLLYEQCQKFRPEVAVVANEQRVDEFSAKFNGSGYKPEIHAGSRGLELAASLAEVDYVMAAIVGAAGLPATLAAAQAGKRTLLANKEALVMSGRLFMEAVREGGAELVPIDSEHNAVFQCLPVRAPRAGVRRILLTASGGPFRDRSPRDLESVTPEAACAHPNWEMGPKISVDSATMMNKALEVIEACWLFETVPDRVEVVVHPQSTVHSMVEYEDGSILAQLGTPDMRTPIAHALAWPERIDSGVPGIDFSVPLRLDFEPPDFGWAPCLRLGYEAARAGGTLPTVLNAANEVVVAAFLDRRAKFSAIPRVVEETLSRSVQREADDLDTILDEDAAAREIATALVG